MQRRKLRIEKHGKNIRMLFENMVLEQPNICILMRQKISRKNKRNITIKDLLFYIHMVSVHHFTLILTQTKELNNRKFYTASSGYFQS